jgi:hypothetical protein
MDLNHVYRWAKSFNDLGLKAWQFYREGKLACSSVNQGVTLLTIACTLPNLPLKGDRIRNPITPSSATISPPIFCSRRNPLPFPWSPHTHTCSSRLSPTKMRYVSSSRATFSLTIRCCNGALPSVMTSQHPKQMELWCSPPSSNAGLDFQSVISFMAF